MSIYVVQLSLIITPKFTDFSLLSIDYSYHV